MKCVCFADTCTYIHTYIHTCSKTLVRNYKIQSIVDAEHKGVLDISNLNAAEDWNMFLNSNTWSDMEQQTT